MTIIALDVPHRLPPKCWTATDQDDYVVRLLQSHDWADEDLTYDAAVARHAADLQRCYVWQSADEAAAAYNAGDLGAHQYEAASAALYVMISKHAYEITDPAIAVLFTTDRA
jgi:hypothetical protein